jgi:polysaccharide export outer membrane protein
MQIQRSRYIKLAAAAVLMCALAACEVPRGGPNITELLSSADTEGDNAHIVAVDARVTKITNSPVALGFSQTLRSAGTLGTDIILPGDRLGITIWENVQDGLLSPPTANVQVLDEVQVDNEGLIFVPYLGRLHAAGKTPEQLRRLLTRRLGEKTPDPQVELRRFAGDGATVSVTGGVGAQGVYPIDRSTRTLAAMLARSGGIAFDPEAAQVSVLRGHETGRVWYSDLVTQPGLDIALRNNDKIFVEQDRRNFSVLGATGRQDNVDFDTPVITAVEALAKVGGLSLGAADPKGVFVLRSEPSEIAKQVLGRSDSIGPQQMIYVLDLTVPMGLFHARNFTIRDGDTIYVTEAPATQWSKSISILTGSLGAVSSVNTLTDGG